MKPKRRLLVGRADLVLDAIDASRVVVGRVQRHEYGRGDRCDGADDG